jgi:hypothetical protein
MAADIRTFWSTLLSVLLKCIAALGFAPADRATARRQAAAAGTTVEAAAQVAGEARAEVAVGAAPAHVGPPAPSSRRGVGGRIPAPRAGESRVVRRSRGRTLPPTMKQRIGAEAHGSSPSSRSLPADEFVGGFDDLADLGLAAVGGTPVGTADRTAGPARETRAARQTRGVHESRQTREAREADRAHEIHESHETSPIGSAGPIRSIRSARSIREAGPDHVADERDSRELTACAA